MSHQIYYTSAPEGLKPGTSGFCTVAASENIPKPLWDRLETLSAYRHQFAAGQAPTNGGNPVSFAHWILNVSGKSHHVLSRICDSGVDHTQRTNAFAHHLVIDRGDMESAPGGPAWMLEQPGVMAHHWDGRVGALPLPTLPRGDSYSRSRICNAWASITGDAGWGGHLADLFAKAPTRPVCLLFAPSQDVLPLLAEAIALLPPTARWNVTFNTYFTSMPTSATCLWRCCLAGTPAAETGLRYAATGLVLDLTDRSRLPALPPGPYVTMARTGQSVESARPVEIKTPPQSAPAETKNRAAGPANKSPAPIYDPIGDAEEREAEHRRDDFFNNLAAPPSESAANAPYDLQGDAAAASANRSRTRPPGGTFRRADEALEAAEREAAESAQRRRKQVMYLFVGAFGAIALGAVTVIYLLRDTAPPETPSTNTVVNTRTVQTAPIVSTAGGGASAPATVVATAKTAPATAAIVDTRPVETAPKIVAPEITYPDTIALSASLERPNVGTGIGDRSQLLPLRIADVDPLPVTALRFLPFVGQEDKLSKAAPPSTPGAAAYRNSTLGTLSAVPTNGASTRKSLALYWKPAADTGLGAEFAVLSFDRAKQGLEIQWHAAQLLRNPNVYNYVFWVLQCSALELDSTRPTKQRVTMKPFTPPNVALADTATDLTWPVELPRDIHVKEPAQDVLPTGWTAQWYPDWDTKDPAARTPENALQIIKFRKTTTNPTIDAWFLLTFKPNLGRVESTFAKHFKQDQDDLAKAEKDLADLLKKIDSIKNDPALATFGGSVPQELVNKQIEVQALVDAYKAAVAGYNQLDEFDVSFELSDNVRLLTLHFRKNK
jgi:hypothetical protein